MATALDRDVRRLLDRAVRKARVVAEDGARKALTELALEDAKKPEGLSPSRTDLRNRLRAHARSLGDVMASDDSIRANRLVREIAYEHWHRALFARFLSENNLLLLPEARQPLSLSELEQIAEEERRDPVELAADWAEPMLPQIFRKDDPVLALALPPETKSGIIDIVKELPRAVFTADDSLGWVYQFWQADQKDRVNASEVKIGADELPAVTQLFTEDYMVLFLLENTLGAWWAGRVLAANPTLATSAASEDELREKTSPPGYRWTYLRFVRDPSSAVKAGEEESPWRPASGTFDGWPKVASEITVLDPCMGSGHFLVFALPIFVAFRRAEDGLDERAAVKAALADNLFGLEIDPRCTQIAAFALALASWKRLGVPEPLPRLNLACSGLAIGLGKAEFLKLAEHISNVSGWTGETNLLGTERTPLGERAAVRLRGGLERLYDMFEKAPSLGSLIDPRRTVAGDFGNLFEEGYDGLNSVLQKVLETEDTNEGREAAVIAQGLSKAAELLTRTFVLVTTNVPYLGKGKMGQELKEHVELKYPSASADLATSFIQRIFAFLEPGSTQCTVTPQNWWFLDSFRSLRSHILTRDDVCALVDLGSAAFSDMNWWAAKTSLQVISSQGFGKRCLCLDASSDKWPDAKAVQCVTGDIVVRSNQHFQGHPDSRLVFGELTELELLNKHANSYQGIKTGDDYSFRRLFWELDSIRSAWRFLQSTVETSTPYGGRSSLLRWDSPDQIARLQGVSAHGLVGVAMNQMNELPCAIYTGDAFDSNISAIVPKHAKLDAALWAFSQTTEYRVEVRKIEPNVKVNNATFTKVPFDIAHWQSIASEKYPNGLPEPYSNDPTQWLFDGHPRGSADPNVTSDDSSNPGLVAPRGVRPGMAEHPLQVAVARLLGYRWPRQTGSSFMNCPAITDPDEVDRSGLIDADGIVPLPALVAEADAATRLRELIRVAWDADYGEGTIRELLAAEEAKATDLATWLADEFFDAHCRLFHQTPFVWHISDGVRGGFSALVNYHRLCEPDGAGRRLLEKLRDSYLGEWIAAQRRAVAAGEFGAEDRLIAAEHLRGELTKIVEGEPPYDIFVRWKPAYSQPLGWEPDIDDGVRLNIRPFLTAKPNNQTRRDACILRVTPHLKKHDGADRGAEPHRGKDDFPWFWANDDDVARVDFPGGPAFKGRRYNDFHYSRAFKQRARDARNKKA